MKREILQQFAGTDDSAAPVTDLRFTYVLKEGVKETTIDKPPEDDKEILAVKITWDSTGAVKSCLDQWNDAWIEDTKSLISYCRQLGAPPSLSLLIPNVENSVCP